MAPTVAPSPSRTLLRERATVLALSAAVTGAFALWNPPLRDLAAHTFRADYFQHYGLALWNASWYGGEYMLSYSILFPPLSALLTPTGAGALSAVACAYFFDRLVRTRWGDSARLASVWFSLLGSVALLANGWLAFALGAAFALGSLRALQLKKPAWASVAALGSALASPVAAVLLALVLIAGGLSASARRPAAAATVAAAALLPVGLLALAFPEGGRFPFWFSAYWPLALTCVTALLAIRGMPEERQLRTVLIAYFAVGTALWLVPNPVGGNVTRLGSLFAGPVLAAVVLSRPVRAPRAIVLAALAVAFGWQVVTPLPDTFQSLGDPSTARAYYEPLAGWLANHGGARDRIEVPYTFNHWETAYLAPRFQLARGWLRQADIARNKLFYEGRLTNTLYGRWLRDNGVRFVALADSRLDYSAQQEAALVRSGPAYLRYRASVGRWRVYEVLGTARMVSARNGGRARLARLGPESFTLQVSRPGSFVVRVRPTPYWRIGQGLGCVGRAGQWTLVRAPRPGPVEVVTGFSPSRALEAATGGASRC